ncbi:reverse transcriptase domain-containing protein [Xenorhabdus bovienii]|uniref:reverse transcriptase domain-containing protein n=1 Tax=Xenorhabdus bovienii TaxID=40576 RepID=UPI0023B2AB7E|nr:reverse transcriptase domain-containing protein [Xenorhabdus bovienii]
MLNVDIKGFFDNIEHELLMKAVRRHTDCKWIVLYIKRWLTAPVLMPDGNLQERNKGTPQGGVISPLLANLFLHYTFDIWMARNFPVISFERYADDVVIHCKSHAQAAMLRDVLEQRLVACKLGLSLRKTKIVYCKGGKRTEDYPEISFDFLGYTFRPRKSKAGNGSIFLSFLPAISGQSAKAIRQTVRGWKLQRRTLIPLGEVARWINPVLRGWITYYGRFYQSALYPVMEQVELHLASGLPASTNVRGEVWLAHTSGCGGYVVSVRLCLCIGVWSIENERFNDKSRMTRECHVRFCGSVGGGSPAPPDNP